MANWRPDASFYPTPRDAAKSERETLAYLAMLDPKHERPDAIGVVDVDQTSKSYGQLIWQTDMPSVGDELHHFGWNACSSHLCPWTPHPHAERRFLVVPGLHSSNVHILDTKENPRQPVLVRTIDGETVARKTGYNALHTVHCGPDGIYINGLGAPDGDGPGGIFMLDHRTFDVVGRWEKQRGPQYLSYDFFWHLGHDTMITSEWATPNMVKDGLDPEILLAGKYGNRLHVWDLPTRTHRQVLELGPQYQMPFELRPAHDPRRAYGFVGVVISLEDLSSSVWMWYLDHENGTSAWKIRKVIDIPAQPAAEDDLPPMLKGFKAVPPLVTDLSLSVDDRFLYVSCWGTGELRQYDVSDPFNPKLNATLQIGGIVRRAAHPKNPTRRLNGGPQMVEVSRDGKRVYLTNSLYSPVDAQFYPDGVNGWMAKIDVHGRGGMAFDRKFLIELEGGMRSHQVRLEGGDASSDSFCYA